MKEALDHLAAIEAEYGVGVLLGVESGSRAWGFPSADSDYDVRFVYTRPACAYLRLSLPRDVIEKPINDLWDVNGWDLRKALVLLGKGNPAIVEWLRSPIVYRNTPTAEAMRQLVSDFADPAQSVRHYAGLLRSTWLHEFGDRPVVRLKQYFYGIRAAAALAWIRDTGETPPMDLPSLEPSLPASVAPILPALREKKALGDESKRIPRVAELDAFMAEMLGWTGTVEQRYHVPPGYEAAADVILLDALAKRAT